MQQLVFCARGEMEAEKERVWNQLIGIPAPTYWAWWECFLKQELWMAAPITWCPQTSNRSTEAAAVHFKPLESETACCMQCGVSSLSGRPMSYVASPKSLPANTFHMIQWNVAQFVQLHKILKKFATLLPHVTVAFSSPIIIIIQDWFICVCACEI